MKLLAWLLGVFAVVVVGTYAFSLYNRDTITVQESMAARPTLTLPEIVPIEHATGLLRWGDATVYFDPTGGPEAFAGRPAADLVLVTDVHGDHFSTSTLEAVVGPATALVVPQAVLEQLPERLAARAVVLHNGESRSEQGFAITAVPMYNLPGSENANFHVPGRGNGYLLERDGVRVYIAGDTAGTPEMRALQHIDIALVPMNLPYTMGVEEAAEAVLDFKPRRVYPYHYRGSEGLADVERFRELVQAEDPHIEVVLADWYPAQ